MKRQIRQSCFETNSSSTHAICIATDDVLNIPEEIHFGFDDFGWECDTHSSIRAKANYLYTCLPYVAKDYNTLTEYKVVNIAPIVAIKYTATPEKVN